MKKLIWPVACDLAFAQDGSDRVIPGPETSIACAEAFAYVDMCPDGDWKIVPCAGCPRKGEFEGEVMSHIMAEYIESLGASPKNVLSLIGTSFNTQGEARAIAEYLRDNQEFKHLVIVGKWWHMPRAHEWIWVYLKKFELTHVTVEVIPTKTKVGPHYIHNEYWRAIPFNKLRMLWVKVFG